MFFAAAEAEELGHLQDAYYFAHAATRIATRTNCPGCDWYAREALYILGRMEAKAVDGREETAHFVDQSRQRCRDASLFFPSSPRGKACLKEVNEYLEKLFRHLELEAQVKAAAAAAETAAEAAGAEVGGAVEGSGDAEDGDHAAWAAADEEAKQEL